jgi:hypothetical protein
MMKLVLKQRGLDLIHSNPRLAYKQGTADHCAPVTVEVNQLSWDPYEMDRAPKTSL